MQQEVLEHLRAELQRIDRYPFVDAVEQGGEVQVGWQPQRAKPKQRIPKRAKCFASVPPESMYGTVRASGSVARIAPFIASSSAPSNGVSYDGRLVIHSRVTSGPMISSTSRSKAASRPGSTRQSITASAVPGITLAL